MKTRKMKSSSNKKYRNRETRLSNSKNVALPADALISTVVGKFEHMRKTTDISNAAFAALSGILEKMSDAGVFESTPDMKNLLSTVAENDNRYGAGNLDAWFDFLYEKIDGCESREERLNIVKFAKETTASMTKEALDVLVEKASLPNSSLKSLGWALFFEDGETKTFLLERMYHDLPNAPEELRRPEASHASLLHDSQYLGLVLDEKSRKACVEDVFQAGWWGILLETGTFTVDELARRINAEGAEKYPLLEWARGKHIVSIDEVNVLFEELRGDILESDAPEEKWRVHETVLDALGIVLGIGMDEEKPLGIQGIFEEYEKYSNVVVCTLARNSDFDDSGVPSLW